MKQIGTAIILAGGKSSRMGFDKQRLRIGESYIMEAHITKLQLVFEEIIIVSNHPADYADFGCLVVKDEIKNFGPLGGIHSGLKHSSSHYNYLIACDMPFLNIQYVDYLKTCIETSLEKIDAVITRLGEWIEPFNAFYSKTLINKIEHQVTLKQKSIYAMLGLANVLYIEEKTAREFDPDWRMFTNINTLEDLDTFQKED
jgi:molybdopterin-guanine dinucleotide biosynthesis protein A